MAAQVVCCKSAKATWGNGEYFTGLLDNFMIYGSALSAADLGIASPTAIEISGSNVKDGELSLKEGNSASLSATVTPEGADPTVTWESNNPAVATVDANGKVTGVKAGTATVTATAGGKAASVTVTVTNPDNYGIDIVGLDGDTTTLSWKYSRQITARETDGSDFTSVSWTLSSRSAFAFSSWGDGLLGGTTFNKTVTGRTVVIEPQYGNGTATLTVKATRADGTVLTAEKTLINDGGTLRRRHHPSVFPAMV